MPNPYLFAYPTESRYDNAVSGKWILDLQEGSFNTKLLGTINNFERRFAPLKGKVNSILIFVSDADTKITLEDRGAILYDHKLWHLFEGINLEKVLLEFPSAKVPNKFDFAFIASDALILPYTVDFDIAHTKKTNTLANVGTSFTEILRLHAGGYDNFMFIIKNTGATNAMDWEVRASNDDVEYQTLKGVTFTQIAASSYDMFETNKKWHFYQVRVKSAVSTTNAEIYANAIR